MAHWSVGYYTKNITFLGYNLNKVQMYIKLKILLYPKSDKITFSINPNENVFMPFSNNYKVIIINIILL